MIGRLAGKVLRCTPGELLLDVGGVGYLVQIPLGTFYQLSKKGSDTASVHVHTHVREDALQLFGFATEEERDVFERLLSISGVGPRLALAVLSGIEPSELTLAVEQSDHARLVRIPGIGRKTAERIVLELRDRSESRRKTRAAAAGTPATPDPGGLRADAVSALENLGYPRDRAWSAVDDAAAGASGDSLEGLLRAALKRLLR
jgi:Holliday junction DNA helicase RuvA